MMDRTVIIDSGAATIKSGFAGDDTPMSKIPTLVAHNQNEGTKQVNFVDFSSLETYTKYKSYVESNGKYKLTRDIIDRGVVKDWDNLETLWKHLLDKELSVDPTECNLMMTEALFVPKTQREAMAERLFENFKFPHVTFAEASMLPLYSAGLTTGIVLECGESFAQTYPVWEGYPFSEAIFREDLAGARVTAFLSTKLQQKSNATQLPRETLNHLKETCCHISTSEGKNEQPTEFQLPDGQKISIDQEKNLREILFDPSSVDNVEMPGLHQLLYKAIMKTNMDIRKDMYANIVLSGGTTMMEGFKDCLLKELESLTYPNTKINIIAAPNRLHNVWAGASILACLSSFKNSLISKQEFEEVGPSVVNKRM